jgi:hypothetical protein
MIASAKKRRPVVGFRLEADTLSEFQAQLRQRHLAMQPTLEGWVRRWLDHAGDSPEAILEEVRDAQNDFRELLLALAEKVQPASVRR